MKKVDIQKEMLNAMKAMRRREEIDSYGKLVSFRPMITKNRKNTTEKTLKS